MIAISDAKNKSNEYYFERIRDLLIKICNFDLHTYKDKFLHRRVQTVMISEKAESVGDYYKILLENPDKISKLIKSLSISVSNFFRNEQVFNYLMDYLGHIKRRATGRYRIWSMGCAKGEEPYSLAMIVEELDFKSAGIQVSIDASDINESIIKKAKDAIFDKKEIDNVPGHYAKYFHHCGEDVYRIDSRLKTNVKFRCENLLNLEPRYGWYHMIVCRNLLIFLEKNHQELLLKVINQSIVEDGLIVLGLTENIPAKFDDQWEPLSGKLRIFKKK